MTSTAKNYNEKNKIIKKINTTGQHVFRIGVTFKQFSSLFICLTIINVEIALLFSGTYLFFTFSSLAFLSSSVSTYPVRMNRTRASTAALI